MRLLFLPLLAACGNPIIEPGVVDTDVVAFFDKDGDGVPVEDDCNDDDPYVFEVGTEVCNGIDDDCDGVADNNGAEPGTWYPDSDGDGWGDGSGTSTVACDQPSGTAEFGTDCNDDDDTVYPGAAEDCAATVDANCDGSVGFVDNDNDGYAACEECDDADPNRNPGLPELCDAADLDEDCDGNADDADVEGATGTITWWPDTDGDGEGDASVASTDSCDPTGSWAENDTDCDDTDFTVYAGAAEQCDDSVDNNCDGQVDEGCSVGTCDPADTLITSCAELQGITDTGAYCLGGDIDCASVGFTAIPSFSGSLNGDGHVVRNLTVTGGGLFAQTTGASIHDLGIEDAQVSGGDETGALVGHAGGLTNIRNVWATGMIGGSDETGGLVGDLAGSSTINGCWTDVDILALNGFKVGGLVGRQSDSEIRDSYSRGSLTAERSAGGLVGKIVNGGDVHGSWSSVNVGIVLDHQSLGGLIGEVPTTSVGTEIHDSYAVGWVDSHSVGGSQLGGGFGGLFDEGATYSSWSAARVPASNGSFGSLGSTLTVEMVVDQEASGATSAEGGALYDSGTMITATPYAAFDFSSVWKQTDGETYPCHQWDGICHEPSPCGPPTRGIIVYVSVSGSGSACDKATPCDIGQGLSMVNGVADATLALTTDIVAPGGSATLTLGDHGSVCAAGGVAQVTDLTVELGRNSLVRNLSFTRGGVVGTGFVGRSTIDNVEFNADAPITLGSHEGHVTVRDAEIHGAIPGTPMIAIGRTTDTEGSFWLTRSNLDGTSGTAGLSYTGNIGLDRIRIDDGTRIVNAGLAEAISLNQVPNASSDSSRLAVLIDGVSIDVGSLDSHGISHGTGANGDISGWIEVRNSSIRSAYWGLHAGGPSGTATSNVEVRVLNSGFTSFHAANPDMLHALVPTGGRQCWDVDANSFGWEGPVPAQMRFENNNVFEIVSAADLGPRNGGVGVVLPPTFGDPTGGCIAPVVP